VERLKVEDEYNSNYQNKEIEYAMKRFNFYLCERCESPFYGGFKECGDEEEEKKLCLDCFDYSKIKGVNNCEIHGRNNIQYKCKFCCNISSHFCWGTTHFCEDCHIKQINRCCSVMPCDEDCPFKGYHAENGEEYGICCLLCLDKYD
jgi:E3 ubiquitin-protein ligase MYCBP2